MINVVLFKPEIPQNTGNIMRTCSATNTKLHIIGPIKFSIDEKNLRRAGMDYIKDVQTTYYNNYEEFKTKNYNPKIYCISRYGKNTYSNIDFSNKQEEVFLMFGSESTGIEKYILKENFNDTLRIPMLPSARSLNLSNCVSLVLFEVLRQRKFHGLSTLEQIKGEDFILK